MLPNLSTYSRVRLVIDLLRRVVRTAGGWVVRAAIATSVGLPYADWGLALDAELGLCFEGVALSELLKHWGSPLFVVQASRLAENVAEVQRPRGDSDQRCELYYSCKTNPIPGVLALLREAGAGIEVTSPYELWLASRAGFRSGQIIYNGPGKSEETLRTLVAADLLLININHAEEIDLLVRVAREAGRRPRVGIRVVAPGSWAGQLGIPIAGGAALAAYKAALDSDAMDVVAIHAHRGALIDSLAQLESFADAILDLAGELSARFGLSIQIFDFGGSLAIPTVTPVTPRARRLNQGFGIPIRPPDPSTALSLRVYADTLMERVHGRARRERWPAPRVFVELGRAVTGNAQMLLATVLAVNEANERKFAVLDAGINIAEPVLHEYHQLFPLETESTETRLYTLTGPISSPGDVLYPAVRLSRLRVGDSLAIMDAGAYFIPFATSFSFPQPAIVLVRDGNETLLRRAESFDDLVARDV